MQHVSNKMANLSVSAIMDLWVMEGPIVEIKMNARSGPVRFVESTRPAIIHMEVFIVFALKASKLPITTACLSLMMAHIV
ncbi:UNVERIFIED_CONTAM: hypothetical protein K2H54_035773 [Gekko kuhli]